MAKGSINVGAFGGSYIQFTDEIPSEPIPRNADTLNGYDSTHFISTTELPTILSTLTKIISQSYIGDGTGARVIPLEFTPKLVIILSNTEMSIKMAQCTFRQLVYQGSGSAGAYNTSYKIVENGFEVGTGDGVTQAALHSDSNTTGVTYNYVAIG